MRGSDMQTGLLFSFVVIEEWLRPDHPLQVIRALTDEIWRRLPAALLGRPKSLPLAPPEPSAGASFASRKANFNRRFQQVGLDIA